MNLIDKLPYFYSEGIPKVIQDSLTVERDLVNENIEELLKQFFIDSATYGLDYWEKMIGINKNSKHPEEAFKLIEIINTDKLVKFCDGLNCDVADIIEYFP